MRRLAILALGAVLVAPAGVAAQSPYPTSATPYRVYLENKLAALEALRDILVTGEPDDAAAQAAPVADHYEQFLLATRPDPCYSSLYVNDWHVATLVRLLAEVPQVQRQDMVDLLADRLAAASLDDIQCDTAEGPLATTSPPTVFSTPAPTPTPKATMKPEPTPRPSYKRLNTRAWQRLVRSPDDHIGERIQLWACIYQFDSATGPEAFQALAAPRKLGELAWYTSGENSQFTGPAKRLDPFVKGDLVWMNVIVNGSYSYDTQQGGNTTVPTFAVQGIRRKGSCD